MVNSQGMGSVNNSKSELDEELKMELKQIGLKLFRRNYSTDDQLINLLQRAEVILFKVNQEPSASTKNSLAPTLLALESDEFLQYGNINVQLRVASCLNEILRIGAPLPLYDDDHKMEALFRLFMVALKQLSNKSITNYATPCRILEMLAKVKSCLLMIDVGSGGLIIEMFQLLFSTIRSDHPAQIYVYMQIIMTMVIEEIDENQISCELLKPLLTSVRKANKIASPISWELGKTVIEKCATKLKPYIREAVVNLAIDDYAETVLYLCRNTPNRETMEVREVSETVHFDKGVSNLPRHLEVAQDVKAPGINGESLVGPSKTSEQDALQTLQSGEHVSNLDGHLEAGRDVKALDLNGDSGHISNDNSLLELPISSEQDRKASQTLQSDQGVSDSKGHMVAEKDVEAHDVIDKSLLGPLRSSEQDREDLHTLESDVGIPNLDGHLEAEQDVKASDINGHISNDESLRSSEQDKKTSQTLQSAEVISNLDGNLEAEQDIKASNIDDDNRPTSNDENMLEPARSPEQIVAAIVHKDKRKKSLRRKSVKMTNLKSGRIGPSDSSQKVSGSGIGSVKEVQLQNEGNRKDDLHDLELSTPIRKQIHQRKKPEISTVDHGEELLTLRIKVWWSMDETFYTGTVTAFDAIHKKHTITYDDDEKETLNLKEETWELLSDETPQEASKQPAAEEPSKRRVKKAKRKTVPSRDKHSAAPSPKRLKLESNSREDVHNAPQMVHSPEDAKISHKSEAENGSGGKCSTPLNQRELRISTRSTKGYHHRHRLGRFFI